MHERLTRLRHAAWRHVYIASHNHSALQGRSLQAGADMETGQKVFVKPQSALARAMGLAGWRGRRGFMRLPADKSRKFQH